MRRLPSNPGRWLVLFFGLVLLRLASGCASTNEENLSERPWNTPKSWETGLPTGMMEERR
jgi:hypothetical protein